MSSAVSLGAGGHLNGVEVTPTIDPSTGELGQHVTQGERAGHRVELVAALDQPGRVGRVQVGAEGHDQDVAVERAGVGLDPRGDGVDRADRRLHERDARLHEVAVRVDDGVGDASART